MFDFINNDIPDELKTLFILNASIRKHSSIGVLTKRCSESMQPIYRRTPMPKLKSHFSVDVFLYIGCILSEHLFLRTPMEGFFF